MWLTKQGSSLHLMHAARGLRARRWLYLSTAARYQQPAAAPLPLAGPITGDLLDTALAALFEANLTTLVTWLDVSSAACGAWGTAWQRTWRCRRQHAGWAARAGRVRFCFACPAPSVPCCWINRPPATSLQQEVPDLVNQLLSSGFAGTLCEWAVSVAGWQLMCSACWAGS